MTQGATPQFISITPEQLEAAIEAGARRALASVGLGDAEAGGDIKDLRSLMDAFRGVRKGLWHGLSATISKVMMWLFIGLVLWIVTRGHTSWFSNGAP